MWYKPDCSDSGMPFLRVGAKSAVAADEITTKAKSFLRNIVRSFWLGWLKIFGSSGWSAVMHRNESFFLLFSSSVQKTRKIPINTVLAGDFRPFFVKRKWVTCFLVKKIEKCPFWQP